VSINDEKNTPLLLSMTVGSCIAESLDDGLGDKYGMTGSNDFGLRVNWPKPNSTSYRSVNKYGGIKVRSEREISRLVRVNKLS
jgi:hypothetical protein